MKQAILKNNLITRRKVMLLYMEQQRESKTIGSIVYLLLSFPLGLTYFLITVIGLSVGLGTVVIWVGLPILFGTLFAIRGMAVVERQLVASLLRFPMPARYDEQSEAHRSLLHRFSYMLRDPHTWTSMLYMILKLPLGILSFTLALTLPIV